MFTVGSRAIASSTGRLGAGAWLGLLALLAQGCFTSPKQVDVGNVQCQSTDDCPSGYMCKYPGRVGGCCRPDDLACGAAADASPLLGDASSAGEKSDGPADALPQPSDARVGGALGNPETAGGNGGAQGSDSPDGPRGSGGLQGTGASGGAGAAAGGAGGGMTIASLGSGGAAGSVGSGGTGLSGGSGGTTVSGGSGGTTVVSGGTGGTPVPDAGRDLGADVPLPPPQDAATGGCSLDKDCPTQTPLCLSGKCAKCGADSDCTGRAGPACDPTSGLCVACTADKYCTGAAKKCNTSTHQCTGCLTRGDCSGACQACSNGTCTAVKNQDDPGGCAGTCDATGACKAKQGQTCSTGSDCVGGTCADGYCCNGTCNQSCEACNIAGHEGTCTPLSAGATPLSGHPACSSADSRCPSSCQGANTCAYSNNTPCGQATCSSDHLGYQYAGSCSNGTCNFPAAGSCGTGKYCTGAASCVAQKSNGTGSCANNYECVNNNCSNAICCAAGMTACSGTCTFVTADAANCGSCGHACSATQGCCNGTCMDVTSDSNNCGFCGIVCGAGTACGSGSCKLVDGQSCTSNSQCLNNNCAPTGAVGQGLCCPVNYHWCDGICIPNGEAC